MLKRIIPAIAVTVLIAAIVYSQSPKASSDTSKAGVSEYEAAIETIATSTDFKAVQKAASLLGSGGLESIAVMAKHLGDKRSLPSNYVSRDAEGQPTVGTHCFWTIQAQLEKGHPKAEQYSGLDEDTLKEWLNARAGMSIDELRREACIGSIRDILENAKAYPNHDFSKVLKIYCDQLIELDTVVNEKKRSEKKSPPPK